MTSIPTRTSHLWVSGQWMPSAHILRHGIRPKFPTLSSRVFSYRERLFLFDCPRKVLKMFTVNE